MDNEIIVEAGRLRELVYEIIRLGGSDAEECRIVSDHLVEANLTGHDSHGVGIIPTYIANLQKKLLLPNTSVQNTSDNGSFLQFDGGKGYGQRVAAEAMEYALERCKMTGVVVMTLKNSHHIGRVGAYGKMATEAGFISLHFVNVTDHFTIVAPHLGSDSRFGTNPVCIAMPTKEKSRPIILDMATSKVAMGKLRVAHNAGELMQEGILIDKDGRSTRDPGVMFNDPKGALLPFAEHKGYGLALMAELLSGVLSGGGTIQPKNKRLEGIINTMTVIVIDPLRLGDLDWINDEIDAMSKFVKASPPVNLDYPVLIPGDPERISSQFRARNGIRLDTESWNQILISAETVGLPHEKSINISGLE